VHYTVRSEPGGPAGRPARRTNEWSWLCRSGGADKTSKRSRSHPALAFFRVFTPMTFMPKGILTLRSWKWNYRRALVETELTSCQSLSTKPYRCRGQKQNKNKTPPRRKPQYYCYFYKPQLMCTRQALVLHFRFRFFSEHVNTQSRKHTLLPLQQTAV